MAKMMDKKTYYKFMFLISGLWNIAGGALLFILSFTSPSVFELSATSEPHTLLFYHSMVALIISFGVGYYIVSKDIKKNEGVVIIGTLVKFLFFLANLVYFLMGDVNFNFVMIGLGDLFFVVLFIEFLMNKKKE